MQKLPLLKDTKPLSAGRGARPLAALLAAAVLSGALIACSRTAGPAKTASGGADGDGAISGVPAESSPAPADASGRPGASPIPSVSPDENGRFPAIAGDDFERLVTVGEPDAIKPDDSTVTPFMEDKGCAGWLAETFPAIDDWRVLYEYDAYTLRKEMYDPYRYQWRDQYAPNRLTVLTTGQSPDFDVIAVASIEQCAVIADEVFTPRIETLNYYCTGWEEDLRMEGLAGARAVFKDEYDWYPSLWLPERQRAFLLDFNGGNILPVAGMESAPPVIDGSFDVSDFQLPADDRFVTVSLSQPDGAVAWYYYASESQSLQPFEGCGDSYPQYAPLNETTLALLGESRVCIYDLASGSPTSPLAVIGGDGGGLYGQEVKIYHQLATEREGTGRHAIIYRNGNENVWRVCTFNAAGEILTDFSTGLPAAEDSVSGVAYTEGLVYFVYYSNGASDQASRGQYCVDARSGRDHTPQRIG